jgi:DNA (cytosine-5)-methyltransferase 1
MKKIDAADLFAGIGGIRLGFEMAFQKNINFVFSNEIDPACCNTYQSNFGINPRGDITKINSNNIPNFDLLLAGFPCQAFSIAGEQRGFGDNRGQLFFKLCEIIRAKEPKIIFLENVKNLIHHNRGNTFMEIQRVLTNELGYNLYWKILNAKDFGVPQNRERIYIVGFKKEFILNENFEFPTPNSKKVALKSILEHEVPVKYYISQRYLDSMKLHKERHKNLGHGFGYEILSKEGFSNALVCGGMGHERNLIQDISNIVKKNSDESKNREYLRKLTPREWARLQGFPDSFILPNSDTKSYHQLGNSVAVPVVQEIAKKLLKSLDRH